MKVRFTAEIIDDNGKVAGKRTSEEGGIPSMEDFDLSTKEGFLRDFNTLENAVMAARNHVGKEITDELLDSASKKTVFPRLRKKNRSRIRDWKGSCPCFRQSGTITAAQGKDL